MVCHVPINYIISIHSLARRLTWVKLAIFFYEIISIHSLARRLTQSVVAISRGYSISIHSLARRLTLAPFV